MTRLIDADELLKELEDWKADLYDTSSDRQLGVTDAIVIACQMPTIDAVPVIRCKDCKYWETDDDESFCSDWGAYGTGAESYCSFAKRKEE